MTSARVDTTDKVRCFAYVMESGYCARANTIKSYVQMNLDVRHFGPRPNGKRTKSAIAADGQSWCLLSSLGARGKEFIHPPSSSDQSEDAGTEAYAASSLAHNRSLSVVLVFVRRSVPSVSLVRERAWGTVLQSKSQ